jgi:hypothetical protein
MASSNGLRMPFAEWLWRMSMAKLSPSKRMVATYAAAFNITSNSDLEKLTGLSEETLRGIKQQLPKDGFVIIEAGIGGRGHGARVFPAFEQTPLTFTDLSPKNPHKYYGPKVPGTPPEITPLTEGTPGVFQGVSKKVSPTPPSKNLLITTVEQEDRFNPPYPPSGERIAVHGGQVVLFNGLRQFWLEQFGGDEGRLELALIDAGGNIQSNNPIAIEKQVSRRLAQIAGDKRDRDARYTATVKANAKTSSKRMSFDELSDNVDAVFERQNPQSKPARLTHER